jgi:hypothetical protein
MQIKTTARFYLTPVRIVTIKNTTNNKCCTYCEYGGWECKLVQPLWKTVWRHLKKLELDLPSDPTTPLLRIYPKECEPGYNKGTCTPIFIKSLLIVAKPRCPLLTDGLRNCGVYTQWNFTEPQRRV